MSRRLPLCARCGKSMKGTSRVVLGWDGVPGKPSLGWHMYDGHDCLEKDRDAGVLLAQPYDERQGELDRDDAKLIEAIREIERRGPGRVVANRGWDAKSPPTLRLAQ